MRHEAGERVGAILGTKDKVMEFLGFGVYEGDFDPDSPDEETKAVGAVADMAKDAAKMAKEMGMLDYVRRNPRIRLDSGKIVWGCECWWGSEEGMKEHLKQWEEAGNTIKDVDIDEVRKEHD